MQLTITAAASQWFQEHLALTPGMGVKFFGKTTQPHQVKHTPQQGFAVENSLGDAVLNVKRDGVNYHINFSDEWFFSGLVTTVDYTPGADQPHFAFQSEAAPAEAATDPDATTAASRKFEDFWE